MIVSMALLMVVSVGVVMVVFRTAAGYAHENRASESYFKWWWSQHGEPFAARTGVSVSHPRQ
jgi:hypothetical protein